MQDYFPAFDLMSQEIDKTESGLSKKATQRTCAPVLEYLLPNHESRGQGNSRSHFTVDIDARQ